MEEMVRNTHVLVVNTISGCYGMGRRGGIYEKSKLYNLESDLEDPQEEKKTMEVRRTWEVSKKGQVYSAFKRERGIN